MEGLCISSTLSATSGVAASTSFTFDVTEFNILNAYILNELRSDPSSSGVAFSAFKLLYPNSREVTLSTSPFIVPVHEVEGATAFDVKFRLVFTANGVSKESTLATISLTQDAYVIPLGSNIENAKITPLDSNVCGCRSGTECNTDTGECTCEAGYAGSHCTFTSADLIRFQSQVTSSVANLESALNTMTATEAFS